MSNLRVAEFYCGIGGLHFALRDAFPQATVIAAFDVDRDGNQVYESNTGLSPTKVKVLGVLLVDILTVDAGRHRDSVCSFLGSAECISVVVVTSMSAVYASRIATRYRRPTDEKFTEPAMQNADHVCGTHARLRSIGERRWF